MDRTKPLYAVSIVLLIIFGVLVFSIVSYNKARGVVKFTSPQEDITVYIDGEKKGKLPTDIDKIDLGLRTFTFEKEGYKKRSILLDLKPKSQLERIVYLSNEQLPVKDLYSPDEKLTISTVKEDNIITSTLGRNLISLTPTGKKNWTTETQGIILNQPITYKNYLIIDNLIGPFTVYDINTGKLLWTKSSTKGNVSPLVIDDNKIWALSDNDTKLSQYSLNGQLIKDITLEASMVADSFKIEDNGLTFITTSGDYYYIKDSRQKVVHLSNLKPVKSAKIVDDKVYILYNDGDFRLYSTEGKLTFSKTVTELYKSFYFDEYLYLIRKNKFDICDPETGKILSTQKLHEDINYFNKINDQLWIGGDWNFLYIFDKDGKFITARNMRSAVKSVSPLPESDYKLITTENGVFKLKLD